MIGILQVKSPQAVLLPSLGASMYAIAFILSCDVLSSISSDDSFDPQASNSEPTGTNKFNSGRNGLDHITPGGFIRSLMSDNTRVVTSFHSHKVRDSMPYAPPTRRFQHQNPRKK